MSCKQCGKSSRPRYASSPLVRRYHDVSHFHDMDARPSKKVSSKMISGDGDIWVEKLFQSTKTGKFVRMFESTNTGGRIKGEPPSGASKVVYLRSEFVDRANERANQRDRKASVMMGS